FADECTITVFHATWRKAVPHESSKGPELRLNEAPETRLEVEAELGSQRPGSDVVRAAEGGEEVIECDLVGQIDRRQTKAPFVAIAAEEIIVSDGKIKKAAWGHGRRILVVVHGSTSGN